MLLDEGLWRSLSAVDGAHEVAWVYRCVLSMVTLAITMLLSITLAGKAIGLNGTKSADPASVLLTSRTRLGEPRFGENSPITWEGQYRNNSRGTRWRLRQSSACSPKPGSQDEALWAIAAALEHLADVIAAAPNSGGDTGRHAASSHSEQSR